MSYRDLLKAKEVCQLLGVRHRSTVLRYVSSGVLAEPSRRTKSGYGLWRLSDVLTARRILNERRFKSDAA
jgi:predicted site-specific integrase-resolvase